MRAIRAFPPTPGLSRICRPERSSVGPGGGGGVAEIFVGVRSGVISDGDVADAVGVVDAVAVADAVGVAGLGVCVSGAMVGDA